MDWGTTCNDTLCRLQENDPVLERLFINEYSSSNINDNYFCRLGAAIGDNTHLRALHFAATSYLEQGTTLDVGFYKGIKQNSSIREVWISSHFNTDLIHEILNVYQQNSNLTRLEFDWCALDAEGNCFIDTLRNCTSLQIIRIHRCDITDPQLVQIVEAIRGHRLLEKLDLSYNQIGNEGYGLSCCSASVLTIGCL